MDYDRSKLFYEAIGFETKHADRRIAVMSKGPDSFILQNFYVQELAENLVLQLTVPDAGAWWAEHDPVQIAKQFSTKPPVSPALQPWGLVVGFIHDPCGVLWHIVDGKKQH
ncbi:hypothetical protein JK178_15110 [Gluconobacter cerinus]|nr:hypothetical protein [Gluconobacter cerinus]